MSGSKSGNKGKGAERELCKILQESLGGSFTRVPNSGAFLGGKNAWRAGQLSDAQTKIFKGDIIPPDHLPKLVIESKFYKEFPYHQIVSGKPIALLDGWIDQNLDIATAEDFWVICFKANFREWCVVFEAKHQAIFDLDTFSIYKSKKGEKFVTTALASFLAGNKDQVIKVCG